MTHPHVFNSTNTGVKGIIGDSMHWYLYKAQHEANCERCGKSGDTTPDMAELSEPRVQVS
jgi:hypothetical protein